MKFVTVPGQDGRSRAGRKHTARASAITLSGKTLRGYSVRLARTVLQLVALVISLSFVGILSAQAARHSLELCPSGQYCVDDRLQTVGGVR